MPVHMQNEVDQKGEQFHATDFDTRTA
jgi:hypothetical protein